MPGLVAVNFSSSYLIRNYNPCNEQRRASERRFSQRKNPCLPPRWVGDITYVSRQLSFAGRRNGIQMEPGRFVVARSGDGFGGGGGKINGETARVLGNLALAILLAYISMTGQLGWLLDALVSLWLLAVLVPVIGIGAFLWWAGRDIVRGSCPNCGNEFQVFKSMLNKDVQLCPFCSQPFSVEGSEFMRDSVKFSNQSTGFDNFSRTKKGKNASVPIVDVEAEIRDAE